MASERHKQQYRLLREHVEDCIGNPLHAEDWACLKACSGPGVPGYVDPERCQMLFVGLMPSASDVASTKRLRVPFSDGAGEVLSSWLRGAGLYGDRRVGFTTLVKCRMNTMRSKKKVLANCRAFLDAELALARPFVIVALGETVAAALAPDLLAVRTFPEIEGRPFWRVDRMLFFMRDPADFYGKIRGERRSETDVYSRLIAPGHLRRLRPLLMPDDVFASLR